MDSERRGSYNSGGTGSPEYSNAVSSSNTHKTSALNWFNEHPVIATVLWVLGADVSETVNDDSKHGTSKRRGLNRSLSWMDDRGGSIVLDRDADTSTSQMSRTRFTDSSILHGNGSTSRSSDKNEDGGVLLKRNTMQYNDRDADTSRESTTTGIDSPNSNYGFYVTISPQQDHTFPRVPKDDVDS